MELIYVCTLYRRTNELIFDFSIARKMKKKCTTYDWLIAKKYKNIGQSFPK